MFPSGTETAVTGIQVAGAEADEAARPQSVALQLAADVDAARGAVIAAAGTLPEGRREIAAELFQLDGRPLRPGARVLVKHGTSTVQAIVSRSTRGTTSTRSRTSRPTSLETNDIGHARLRLAAELPSSRTRRTVRRLVPRHPSVRRRDARRRHRAGLTARHPPTHPCTPTEGGEL